MGQNMAKAGQFKRKPRFTIAPSLRRRILAFVTGLVLLSLFGSGVSLYRITEVNRILDAVNQVSVPLSRLFAQLQSDGDVFQREMERNLGYSHWKDPHWHPRPIPKWIHDILESEVERIRVLVKTDSAWASAEARIKWQGWVLDIDRGLKELREEGNNLYAALERRDEAAATQIYPRWNASLEEWRRQLQWGTAEYERSLRQTFALAETRAAELRTGLEIVLAVVVLLSLLFLWLGERALRPLGELTKLAREITRRGLQKGDKALVPLAPLSRNDEVTQLAREFHRMATALLEREKIVEMQKHQLQEQNRLLRKMGELNENVLNSIESVLIVTDLSGKITQCNPVASEWLSAGCGKTVFGTELLEWPRFKPFVERGARTWFSALERTSTALKIDPCVVEVPAAGVVDGNDRGSAKTFGGHVMPLRQENGAARGAIIVLEDLTEELDLQQRLNRAENLAAVGRLSAQVAHEVRNPLHSIGLEAEMAAELAAALGHIPLKQSLQSILGSVDRLEKITQNYLKLSRLSAGEKKRVDIGEVLESVLATYASVCEAESVRVDWHREELSSLLVFGDRDLLEQVLGNLFRNALQALESVSAGDPAGNGRAIHCSMGNAESGRVWLRIEDNGPGIPSEIRERLFTPFVTTRPQGTGLGLSFARKVIEDHGGSITCADRVPGEGTCFEILLPQLSQKTTDAALEAGEPVSPQKEFVNA